MRVLVLALSLIFSAAAARSADGVLEIGQTCAVESGCFPGDSERFPVTVDGSAGRSHRPTSDLVVPDQNKDAIVIASDDVSFDLAGFEIRGPVVCSGSPTSCFPSVGTGSGVRTETTARFGISLRNGIVRGTGASGFSLGNQAEIKNLRARSNRKTGIVVGSGSTVSESSAHENGGTGFSGGIGSTVIGNAAF